MNKPITASDATYHNRHTARSLRRARCIASHISPGATVLDVGCNRGLTSDYLLQQGIAKHVTGVELHADTVDESLRNDSRFSLVEGNVSEIDISDNYDECIYGAVHHHILNFHGLSAAVATLQKLASRCDRHLFLETGQISEGGRWDWQRAIRRYFRTDEEHFFYLLRSIENQIEDFEIIGKFWIHGARRWYLRIDMKSRTERVPASVPAERFTDIDDIEGPFVRSWGSGNQVLKPATDETGNDSPAMFSIARSADERDLFIKQHRHHPAAAEMEYLIGHQVAQQWAVLAIGTTNAPGTLVFPYIGDAQSIRELRSASKDVRSNVARQVLRIFADARQVEVDIPPRPLLATKRNAKLVDVCDLHQYNFLVQEQASGKMVRVVDFEQQSADYAWRNRLHLARILWLLRCHHGRALLELLLGLAGALSKLLIYQASSTVERIRQRQPGLLSVMTAELRSRTGRALRLGLGLVGYK